MDPIRIKEKKKRKNSGALFFTNPRSVPST
jgi:hypothetical protein